MPHKSLKYYLNTCLLKSVALTVHVLDRIGALESYKRQNKLYYWRQFEEKFTKKELIKTGNFTDYYITFGYWIKPDYFVKNYVFNDEGVAMYRTDVPSKNHNPFVTAFYGLILYNHFAETGNPDSLEAFWKQVNYLLSIGQTKDECFWIFFPWDNPKFGLKAPWASGLMQSVALSLFIRAWKVSGDNQWKELSNRIFRSLTVPKEKGGVLTLTPEGFSWIEERPTAIFDGTLNGFVFCLVALHEYLHIVDDSMQNREFLTKLLEGYFKSLSFYQFGRFMKYSRASWQFHNVEYQGLYVYLYLHLYRLSGRDVFLEFAQQFEKYTNWENFYSFYGVTDESRCVWDFFELIKSYDKYE